MKTCKYCGSIMMVGVCPVCKRSDLVTPPPLMSATLFDLNPHLKKRLEWRENINRNMGIPDLPFDPSKLTTEDLPSKILPTHQELPIDKKKKKGIPTLEF